MGTVGLKEQPPLSESARRLLEQEGPDAFHAVFGTHFVSAIVVGADAGYCLSLESHEHSERESFSLIAEISLLFWTIEGEVEVTEITKKLSENKLSLTAYDTLTGRFLEVKSRDTDPKAFIAQAREFREHASQLHNRLVTALAETDPLQIASEGSAKVAFGVVLAPWTTLLDWHLGVMKWEQNSPPEELV